MTTNEIETLRATTLYRIAGVSSRPEFWKLSTAAKRKAASKAATELNRAKIPVPTLPGVRWSAEKVLTTW